MVQENILGGLCLFGAIPIAYTNPPIITRP